MHLQTGSNSPLPSSDLQTSHPPAIPISVSGLYLASKASQFSADRFEYSWVECKSHRLDSTRVIQYFMPRTTVQLTCPCGHLSELLRATNSQRERVSYFPPRSTKLKSWPMSSTMSQFRKIAIEWILLAKRCLRSLLHFWAESSTSGMTESRLHGNSPLGKEVWLAGTGKKVCTTLLHMPVSSDNRNFSVVLDWQDHNDIC